MAKGNRGKREDVKKVSGKTLKEKRQAKKEKARPKLSNKKKF